MVLRWEERHVPGRCVTMPFSEYFFPLKDHAGGAVVRDELLRQFEPRRRHAYEKIRWLIPTQDLRGRFLDIGCGCGNGLVAALQLGFDSAVGVDRSFSEFIWFTAQDLDDLCRHYDVSPAKATLIEADLFNMSLQPEAFNCVLMLDSIEHVPEPRRFINAAARYVAPGGYLLIDTCPLFYSKQGHHLWDYFPPKTLPWVHLRKDWPDILRRTPLVSAWSMDRFNELNKVTHDQIRHFVLDTGLEIVTEHRDFATTEDVALLDEHRESLNFSELDERVLFEAWILLVSRRPAIFLGERAF